ncbi:Nucleotide-sugar transporter family protein [Hibiscus syriacus]|uniref:Nucleotide-sugar transporter family protein n=1 Tax=Hibiscus syriacus TaxID=106335 RepID=A0A6A2YDI2_HIBSY|nr:Nucleotide-sugar transporter family protein [Hibiscus syriacus]
MHIKMFVVRKCATNFVIMKELTEKGSVEFNILVLKEKGVKANETVIVGVISSYAHLGAIGLDVGVSRKLLKFSTKCLRKDVLSWTAVVAGLAMHGYAERALWFFSEMAKSGLKPRDITFTYLLSACSNGGLVERAGKLAEAEKFVLRMPVKPNDPICGALLGACRIHKNAEIAERVGNISIPLLPKHSGYETYDEGKGVKKQSGYSLIEFDGKVHKFTMGEKSHGEIEMIERTWDEILQRIRLAGYTGNTSDAFFDIDEEEKESALHRHSKKLAIAYGIMRTKAPTVI